LSDASSDRIELRGLRVLGTHGVLAEEQARAQPFELDVTIEADLLSASTSDALHETIDYGVVAGAVAAVVSAESVALLETLAERVVAAVFAAAGSRARAVEVTVRKLRPPVPVDLDSAGVRIRRLRETRSERRAFLALGSNVGERWEHLRGALGLLPDVVAVSPVYETDPVGGPPGQGPYLNCVVELRTRLGPHELLAVARRAEVAAGRERAERWGARTLDVDVLLVGDLVVDDDQLTVPHPRMWERDFVLVPLADLAPELVAGCAPERRGVVAGVRFAGSLSPPGRPAPHRGPGRHQPGTQGAPDPR